MYVCICHGIRCRDVREAAHAGKSQPTDVFAQFQVQPQCGQCVEAMASLLQATANGNASPSPAAAVALTGAIAT